MKRWMIWALILTSLVALAFLGGCAPEADDPGKEETKDEPVDEPAEEEISFEGEEIEFIVPMAAGGGTDTAARLFGHFLEQELPGQPTVRVDNMSGGGGALGFNHLFTIADPDLSLGASTAGVLQRWRLEEEGHDYNLEEMPVIGAQVGGRVAYMNAEVAEELGVESAEDLFDLPEGERITFGQTRVGGAHSLMLAGIREEMDIPIFNIYGYDGMAEVDLAMTSGETAASIDSPENYLSNIEPMVEEGDVIPLFQIGLLEDGEFVRDPRIPDVPTIAELYEIGGVEPSEVYGELIDTLQNLILFGTSFFLQPDTSPEVVEVYREAVADFIESEQFVEEGISRTGEEVKGFTGEEVEEGLEILFEMDEETIDAFKDLLAIEEDQ